MNSLLSLSENSREEYIQDFLIETLGFFESLASKRKLKYFSHGLNLSADNNVACDLKEMQMSVQRFNVDAEWMLVFVWLSALFLL